MSQKRGAFLTSFFSSLLLFCGCTLAMVALLEFSAALVYKKKFGARPDYSSRARLALGADLSPWLDKQKPSIEPLEVAANSIHPYYGFVRKGANRYGFVGQEPYFSRDRDEVIVGFFGGSVGFHFSQIQKTNNLIRHAIPGKTVKFVSLALPGYKQPQQLHVFSDMLAQGAVFDIVINLDGFNEVALPHAENLPFGVSPSYPRQWYYHVRKSLNQEQAFLTGKILYTRERKRNTYDFLNAGLIKHSALFATLSKLAENYFDTELLELERRLSDEIGSGVSDKKLLGPSPNFRTEAEEWRALAQVWKNSSRQMHNLAKANDILYIHLLQPNLWVPGSKPFSEEELVIRSKDVHPGYCKAVEEGYPFLVDAGISLATEGVVFKDLTMAFAGDTRTLYYDSCCHFNDDGHEIINRIAAELILEHYKP